MIRGTFANIRLRNQLLDDVSGGYTRDFTQDGEQAFIYDAAQNYAAQDIPLVVLGGKEYGSGLVARLGGQGHQPARRPRGHHRVVRAHPPLQPDRHGRHPAAVPGGRVGGVAEAGRHRDVRHLRHRGAQRGQDAEDGEGHRHQGGRQAVEFDAVVRIDTPGEADYYRNGGILQYVLRNMLKSYDAAITAERGSHCPG